MGKEEGAKLWVQVYENMACGDIHCSFYTSTDEADKGVKKVLLFKKTASDNSTSRLFEGQIFDLPLDEASTGEILAVFKKLLCVCATPQT